MKRYLVELVAKATVRQKLVVLADDDKEAEQNAIRKAWAGKWKIEGVPNDDIEIVHLEALAQED